MESASQLGVRLGFAGGTAMTSIDDVRTDATWASEAGFDSYWLSHVFGVDPLVALACAAPDAPGIEIGTSVLSTVGRHPIAMAQLARSTQQACSGRFTLGVGPSHQVVVESVFGTPWDRPVERTSEYLDALIPLCNGESVALDGEHLSANVTLDVPGDPVPVILAALGPRMLALAGRVAAGTHVGQCGPRTIAEHTAPTINAAAADAGRAAPRIIALINLCVTKDPVALRAAAVETSGWYGALPSYRAMLDREGVADPTDLIAAGSIEQIIDELKRYVDAGATDLRLGVFAPDDAHRQATRDALAEWLA